MKSKKDAILQFLKIKVDGTGIVSNAILIGEAKHQNVEPYNEADMYLNHCSMLIKFGEQPLKE